MEPRERVPVNVRGRRGFRYLIVIVGVSSIAVTSSDYEKTILSMQIWGLYADHDQDSPDKVVEIFPLSPPSV